MKTNLKDIAAECGVSPWTVSVVLNGKGSVSPQTRRRVMAAAKKLNYRKIGEKLPSRTTAFKTLGLVLPQAALLNTNAFFSRAVGAVKQEAGRSEYGCMLFTQEELQGLHAADPGPAAGIPSCAGLILFCPHGDWDKDLRRLKQLDVPAVLVNRSTRLKDIPVVIDDDYDGARQALQHLRSLGHGSIAYVQRRGAQEPARHRAYRDFMRQHFPGQPLHEFTHMGLDVPDQEFTAWLASVSALPDRPTAFFCHDDEVALNVIYRMNVCGLKVPDDASVVGFNDDATALHAIPHLTTVNIPVEDMCVMACRLLTGFKEEIRSPRCEIKLSNHLIVRESSGARPART